MKHGLKHSVILVGVSYVTAILFIMPQPVSTQVIISSVSYNSGGYLGIPQNEPIIFRVTDLQGKPLEKVTVAFKISGPGEGKVNPPTGITNSDGIVSTKATLGPAEGKYTIKAVVGDNSASVDIDARTTTE